MKRGQPVITYNSVCGFDARLEGYTYRDFKKESSEEVLEFIRKENSKHGERQVD